MHDGWSIPKKYSICQHYFDFTAATYLINLNMKMEENMENEAAIAMGALKNKKAAGND